MSEGKIQYIPFDQILESYFKATEEMNDKKSKMSEEQAEYRAKKRKGMPVYSGFLSYFPNAVKYVSTVSLEGNRQHHPDKPLFWDKDKSSDHKDALVRHLIDHSVNPIDEDGILHLGRCAWRAMAALEIYLEENK